jgi:hypothetical protein
LHQEKLRIEETPDLSAFSKSFAPDGSLAFGEEAQILLLYAKSSSTQTDLQFLF